MAKKDFMATFLGEREAAKKAVSNLDTRKILPLGMLSASDENFYDTSDVSDLKASIKEHGLMQPILVDEDKHIIAGHRRHKAVSELFEETNDAKFSRIPCIICNVDNEIEREMMLIEANSTARILSSYEMAEQAKRYDELLTKAAEQGYEYTGRRRDIVAKMMNVSASRVGRLTAILKNISSGWIYLFKDGKVSESVAYAISQHSEDEQKRLINAYCDSEDEVCTQAFVDAFFAKDDEPEAAAEKQQITEERCEKAAEQVNDEPEAAAEKQQIPKERCEKAAVPKAPEIPTPEEEHEATLAAWRQMAEASECAAEKPLNIRNGRNRLTAPRLNGIKTGYWSSATKEELIQRLGEYEDAEERKKG